MRDWQDKLIWPYVKIQTWLGALGEKALKLWTTLDSRADQKLGLISTPLFAPLLGGGIPAYLVSRGIFLAALAFAAWIAVEQHDAKVIAERDAEWNKKLAAQIEQARKEYALRARLTGVQIAQVDKAWKATFSEMRSYTDQIEKLLQEANHSNDALSDQLEKTVCVKPEAVNVLRLKVRSVNKGGLK